MNPEPSACAQAQSSDLGNGDETILPRFRRRFLCVSLDMQFKEMKVEQVP
jgi:hypothetical protein